MKINFSDNAIHEQKKGINFFSKFNVNKIYLLLNNKKKY